MGRLLAMVALVTLVASCGAGRERGPAWPTRSEPDVDGGESLAPRTTSVVAASETKKDAPKTEETAAVTTEGAETPADKPADAKATTAVTAPSDDVIIIDDIVIEIEE